jgi:hypothetical protein
LIDLYKQGKFPVDKIAKIYSPDAIEQALADLHSGSVSAPKSMFQSNTLIDRIYAGDKARYKMGRPVMI